MEKQLTNKSLVPVAYQVRMSDGRWGTIFHHPDKPLGDHRPLYAHQPQPSVSVAEDALCSEILAELTRARAKFTGKNVTFAALVEEVGELAAAAACYITNVCEGGDPEGEGRPPFGWPWSHDWWKPTNPRRDLVKAGALILAEIERLDRMAEKAGGASAAALQRTATIDPDAAEGRN